MPSLRAELESMEAETADPELILMSLAYLNGQGDLAAVACVMGMDPSSRADLEVIARAVHRMTLHGLIEPSASHNRFLCLTPRGRSRELQLREEMIRRHARHKPAPTCG